MVISFDDIFSVHVLEFGRNTEQGINIDAAIKNIPWVGDYKY